ncbi:sugar transferase [Paludicola sp. MB14-C6]|uniref:sugar transferase n=1 Tax=Paludihabitans sp. MB14-C6 TaxID=3070656 RepID=UPI0027DD4B83|nr:sugar transferase [Paludicola sp. MB14-C6]WMJ22591.1 sugar transferase [Paludicola sp. MB14-C6]
MHITEFEKLPVKMQTDSVKVYHEILINKKASLFWKRFLEVILCSFLFLLVSPFFLIFALLIKLTSRGPILFKQERVGKDMRLFYILKFRTMVQDADKKGVQLTTNNDSRITPFGRFLRAINMDEMPQLLNVIKGDMSIIGTRPEVKRYVDVYTDEMYATLLLPPGMLSLASVKYKDENSLLSGKEDPQKVYIEQILPDKMKYNLEYLKKLSVKEDMKLIGKSIACVFQ